MNRLFLIYRLNKITTHEIFLYFCALSNCFIQTIYV
jgi:hypothetical protein